MEKIQVNLHEGQNALIVREGEAEKIRQPKGFSIECALLSVVDFYQKRKKKIDVLSSYLMVDRNKGCVKLVVNDTIVEEQVLINGKLQEDKDCVDLGINENKLFSENDLENAFRKRPHLFFNLEAYEKLMLQLRNFSGEVRQAFAKTDTRQGQQSVSVNVNIDTDGLQKEIQLRLSPWVGYSKTVYNVNIYVTAESGSPAFYLECVQLMMDKQDMLNKALMEVESALSQLPIFYV